SMLDYTNHSGTISSCPDLGAWEIHQVRNVRGAARPRHPSINSAPAGATDAGTESKAGDGLCARPPGSNRRRGRRMPAVRPILGLGLAERHRDEVRRVAGLDPHEDRALALLLRVLESAAHVRRIGNLLAADLENDVAGFDALVGSKSAGIDLGDDHALRAAS